MAKFRKRLSRKGSKKLFRKTAGRTQSINYMAGPQRGGIRL